MDNKINITEELDNLIKALRVSMQEEEDQGINVEKTARALTTILKNNPSAAAIVLEILDKENLPLIDAEIAKIAKEHNNQNILLAKFVEEFLYAGGNNS